LNEEEKKFLLSGAEITFELLIWLASRKSFK